MVIGIALLINEINSTGIVSKWTKMRYPDVNQMNQYDGSSR